MFKISYVWVQKPPKIFRLLWVRQRKSSTHFRGDFFPEKWGLVVNELLVSDVDTEWNAAVQAGCKPVLAPCCAVVLPKCNIKLHLLFISLSLHKHHLSAVASTVWRARGHVTMNAATSVWNQYDSGNTCTPPTCRQTSEPGSAWKQSFAQWKVRHCCRTAGQPSDFYGLVYISRYTNVEKNK